MLNVSSSSNSSSNFHCAQMFICKILTLSRGIAYVPLTAPLALFVLYHGYQRWKPHKSLKNISHSDFFTYNMALTQLLNILGTLTSALGLYSSSDGMTRAGWYLYGSHFVLELLIHCLTCVDRYLAIVKPILYLKLKQSLGFVVRNVSMGTVWLLSFGYIGIQHKDYPGYPIHILIGIILFTFVTVSFCSFYVLFVLTRPSPGDGGQNKMDQSKLKAFQTIVAITVVVLIWVLGILVVSCVDKAVKLDKTAQYVLFEVVIWLSLPSSLVLLVLYLQRAVKCTLCK